MLPCASCLSRSSQHTAQERILPEFVELVNDEEVEVRRVAITHFVRLIDQFNQGAANSSIGLCLFSGAAQRSTVLTSTMPTAASADARRLHVVPCIMKVMQEHSSSLQHTISDVLGMFMWSCRGMCANCGA